MSGSPAERLSGGGEAPDEIGADGVIPDHAEYGAGYSRNPPGLVRFEEPGGHVDIGERADAASERKSGEPPIMLRPRYR